MATASSRRSPAQTPAIVIHVPSMKARGGEKKLRDGLDRPADGEAEALPAGLALTVRYPHLTRTRIFTSQERVPASLSGGPRTAAAASGTG